MLRGTFTGICAALLLGASSSAYAQTFNLRALDVTATVDVVEQGTIDLTATIESAGPQAAPAFTWNAYLTVNGAMDSAILLGSFGPHTIDRLETEVFQETVSAPANVTGFYQVAIVIDQNDTLTERNEFDNMIASAGTTRIRARAPDLMIDGAGASGAQARVGEPITIDFLVQNLGELDANTRVSAYLSRDAVITTSDLLIGSVDVSVIAQNTANAQIAGMLPEADVGDYHLGLIVDPDAQLTEISETNNVYEMRALFNIFEDTLSLQTESIIDGTLGIEYHLRLDSAGGDGHYNYTVASGTLPDGLLISASQGIISGTPTRTGLFNFEIAVQSNGLNDRRSYEVEVFQTGVELGIVTDTLFDGSLDLPYEAQLVASGGEPPYAWTVSEENGDLPSGLDLNPVGVLSGRPDVLGRFRFVIMVVDRLGREDTREYEIEISPAANVFITDSAITEVFAGEPVDASLAATGGIPPYKWEALSTPPPGLTLTEDGRITGTPTRVGRWPLRVQVTDSTLRGASDSSLIEIDIQDGGDLEIQTVTLPKGTVRVTYNATLLATGGQPPLEWSVVPGDALPEGFFLEVPEDAEVGEVRLRGKAFRELARAFRLQVKDAYGRKREVLYGLEIELTDVLSRSGGCVCAARTPELSSLWALLGVVGLWGWRRRSRR